MRNKLIRMTVLFVLFYALILLLIGYQLFAVDTESWFAPTGTLEVQHNGTGQTVNPQMTVDGKTLQGREL